MGRIISYGKFFLIVLTLMLPHNVWGLETTEFIPDVKYEFYEVYGNSFEQLIEMISRYGPYDEETGSRIAASTQWHIQWKYDFSYNYHIKDHLVYVDIDMSKVAIGLEITVILPRVSDSVELSPTDIHKWQQYVKQLLEHENHHVRLIKASFDDQKLLRQLRNLRSIVFQSTSIVVSQEQIRKAVVSKIRELAKRYLYGIKEVNLKFDETEVPFDHCRQ